MFLPVELSTFVPMKQEEINAKDIIDFVSTLDDWYKDGLTVERVTNTKVILNMKHPITKMELVSNLCDYLTEHGKSYSTLRIDDTGDGVFKICTTGDLMTLSKIKLDKCDDTRGSKKCSASRLRALIEKHCPNILDKINYDDCRCFQTRTHYFVDTGTEKYSFKKIYNNGS